MDDATRVQASAGDRLALIEASFERLTGRPLVQPGEALWSMPRAVVAHGTEDVPRFFYGNRLALELFAMRAGQFIGLPSHESAEAGLREERAAMLARLERHDLVDDYSGVRIAADGSPFRIQRATVWNLLDENGVRHGQAATFADWTPV